MKIIILLSTKLSSSLLIIILCILIRDFEIIVNNKVFASFNIKMNLIVKILLLKSKDRIFIGKIIPYIIVRQFMTEFIFLPR